MGELGQADADHSKFPEVIEAEATHQVVVDVGGIDAVVDVIGAAIKVVEEIRLWEEIDVVPQRF